MTCLKSFVVAAMLIASTSWSHAEQPPSANQLVVEASRLIMSAESAQTPDQAIGLLEEAHRKLVLITEVHPSSDMAVKLATGQGIGTVSLAGVQAAIKHFKAAKKDRGLASTFLYSGIRVVPLEADQLAEVIAIAKSSEFENAFDGNGLYYLADSLAWEGTFKNVVEVLKLIDKEYLRDMVLSTLISSEVRAARFTEAVNTTGLNKDPDARVKGFAQIALA